MGTRVLRIGTMGGNDTVLENGMEVSIATLLLSPCHRVAKIAEEAEAEGIAILPVESHLEAAQMALELVGGNEMDAIGLLTSEPIVLTEGCMHTSRSPSETKQNRECRNILTDL